MEQNLGIITMINDISTHTAIGLGTNRFTRLGIITTIVVVLAGSIAQLINYGFFDQRIQALDSGSDW